MKKYRTISKAAVLAALYDLGAVEGRKEFSWQAQDIIARRVTIGRGRKYTRRVGDVLRDLETDGIVEGWRVDKVRWWRVKRRG